MLKQYLLIIVLILSVNGNIFCQETENDPGFQLITHINPAFSGAEGNAKLRLSYLNYYPGNNYNLHSVYLSFDSYYSSLHGGAGFYISNDYLGGIVNDIRSGFSYSYFLQAGKDLFINAGLSASLYHRGFNFSGAILPDQIDPLGTISLPQSEILVAKGRTVFDVGAGFLLMYRNLTAGIALNHLAEPVISLTDSPDDRLRRSLTAHFSYDINVSSKGNIFVKPQLYSSFQGGAFTGGIGAVAESKYLSFNFILIDDIHSNVNMQTGFSVTTGVVTIYYNYRFNLASSNNLVPISLLHQTGLVFSLNNVDKRKITKTINFPKL